jgi:hypothetical protein
MSRNKLRKLIQETVLSEAADFATTSIDDALIFAKGYTELGAKVQEQLVDVVEAYTGRAPDAMYGINPGAVRMIKNKLGGLHAELDEAIIMYEEEMGEEL